MIITFGLFFFFFFFTKIIERIGLDLILYLTLVKRDFYKVKVN